MSDIKWDEYDGQVIDGIRYANTFTANIAKESRRIGAEEERKRIIEIITKHPENWHKSQGLNYRAQLQKIIEKIIGDN